MNTNLISTEKLQQRKDAVRKANWQLDGEESDKLTEDLVYGKPWLYQPKINPLKSALAALDWERNEFNVAKAERLLDRTMHKVCTKCSSFKKRPAFSSTKRNSSGLRSDCKECVAKGREEAKVAIKKETVTISKAELAELVIAADFFASSAGLAEDYSILDEENVKEILALVEKLENKHSLEAYRDEH